MGNGVSCDQGNLPSYGKRDVRRAADRKQHDWSELAVIPETNSLLATANSYTNLETAVRIVLLYSRWGHNLLMFTNYNNVNIFSYSMQTLQKI